MFFFWSFMVLVFMILLNFLLAIIVDAFSEVKERTKETTGKRTSNPFISNRRAAPLVKHPVLVLSALL
jgi:hypothetical protein